MRTLVNIMEEVPKEKWQNQEWNVKDNKSAIIAQLSLRSQFDFFFFTKHVLGLNSPSPLGKFHEDTIKYLYDNKFILIQWPRGHLKTTIFSVAYTIWRLWRESNIKIAIVSSALDQSQKMIEEIESRITDNEFLKGLAPSNRLISWNKTELKTSNGNECFQLPFNSTARGNHVDFLIMDDILREENVSAEVVKEYFWGIFYPEVQTRRGQIVIVGTPQTTKDLYADLSGLKDVVSVKKAAVIVDEQGKWIEPAWSERFTLEELKSIQEHQSSLIFEREYMCNPLGSGANIFKNIKIGNHQELHKPLPNEDYYLGCDVAMQSGAKNDFLAFSLLGKDQKTGLIRQRKVERYKGWNEDMIIKRIKELNSKFNLRKVLIEKIGLSIGVCNTLEKIKEIPIESFKTYKKGKEELVSSINVGFETGVLELLDNTVQFNELVSFKAKEDPRTGKLTYEGVGEHDDTVIALGLAMYGIIAEEAGTVSIAFI